MTKYVINSGGLKKYPDRAKEYFNELLKDLGPNPKLLWCFFATLPDPIEERYQKYVDQFSSCMPDGIEVQNICAEVENIEEQVSEADAIYLHGGSVRPLIGIFGKYKFNRLFDNKSVGTNSASTIMLSKHGWNCDKRIVSDGLGVWPAKVLVHYNSNYGSDDPRGPINWEAAKKELEAYGDTTLPVLALEEGDFKVFEK